MFSFGLTLARAIRRAKCRHAASCVHASELATVLSQSLDSRRRRPSQAKVHSTFQATVAFDAVFPTALEVAVGRAIEEAMMNMHSPSDSFPWRKRLRSLGIR